MSLQLTPAVGRIAFDMIEEARPGSFPRFRL